MYIRGHQCDDVSSMVNNLIITVFISANNLFSGTKPAKAIETTNASDIFNYTGAEKNTHTHILERILKIIIIIIKNSFILRYFEQT